MYSVNRNVSHEYFVSYPMYLMYLAYLMCPMYRTYIHCIPCILCILPSVSYVSCISNVSHVSYVSYPLYRMYLVYPMYPMYPMYPTLCIVCVYPMYPMYPMYPTLCIVCVYPMPNYILYSGIVDWSPCFITFLLEYLPSVELKYIQSILVFTNHIHTRINRINIFTNSTRRRCPWFFENRPKLFG